ncbi:MAG: hypothetical protein KatS3mg105_4403 [Gemmatales bacterium]|nr:MAG: hypothetical protein KatS3mg105_1050 [Gemmatales bacterium]GIW82596.1 MAG: hypothetical protein KatS3mg105_4403 [Gemmatales bacterium]
MSKPVPAIQRPSKEKSAAFVRLLCEQNDQHMRDEFTPAEVVELMTACEYDCDADTIAEFHRKGYLPGIHPDQRTWNAQDVFQLVKALEQRRRWLPNSSKHRHKKPRALVDWESDMDRPDAREAYFAELANYTIEDLLLWLTLEANRDIREAFWIAAREKLKQAGVF